MKMRLTFAGTLAVLGCVLWIQQAAAEAVGRVIAVTPGAFAERAGEIVPLELKSAVHPADTLVTDTTGKVQVLFDDDSSVTLAQGTRLALAAVIPQGDAPSFKANLSEGMARFITGKIVERNPDGFGVMTPESTIGIRGTIFAVRRDGNAGVTSVFVLNTARQVLVNGISVPGEHKITLPHGGVIPMTPTDFKTVNAVASARSAPRGAQGAVALAPASAIEALERPDIPVPSNSLGSSVLLAQEAGGDSLSNSVTGSSSVSGTITGTLSASNNVTGIFSFSANLGSGSISGASMSGGNGAGTSFAANGGNGYINGSRFGVYNGWNGSLQVNGGAANPITNAKMYGDVDVNGSGIKVDGDFRVNAAGGGNYVEGSMVGGNN